MAADRTDRSRGTERARALLALCMSAALFGVQLAESGHPVFATHEVCPEHGELIHVDSAPPLFHQSGEQLGALPSELEHATNGGCHLLAAPRDLLAREPARTADRPHSIGLGLTLADSRRCRGQNILRFAPKSSPPSAS